jgi:hypothetical protein
LTVFTQEMLAHRAAIHDLPIAYCHYVWAGNPAGVASLYAQDGEFVLPPSVGGGIGHVVGREAIEKFIVDANSGIRPFLHNHFIEQIGDGKAKGFAYAEFRDLNCNGRTTHFGVYEDHYVREDGRWKFQSRKVEMTPVD